MRPRLFRSGGRDSPDDAAHTGEKLSLLLPPLRLGTPPPWIPAAGRLFKAAARLTFAFQPVYISSDTGNVSFEPNLATEDCVSALSEQGGAADSQTIKRRELNVLRRRFLTGGDADDRLHRHPPCSQERRLDRRQLRGRPLGLRDVVEAADRKIPGQPDPSAPGGLHYADRDRVAGGHASWQSAAAMYAAEENPDYMPALKLYGHNSGLTGIPALSSAA